MCDNSIRSLSEPSAVFFDNENCSGNIESVKISDGDVTFKTLAKKASSAIVPQNMFVYVWDDKTSGSKRLDAGIYPNIRTAGIKNDSITSAKALPAPSTYDANIKNKEEFWENFRFRCCTGDNDPSVCGSIFDGNACDKIIADGCNKYGSSRCYKYCMENQGSGACDESMKQYCTTNPKDPACSCFISTIAGGPPHCLDKNCINYGYKTKFAQTTNCDITNINCTQIFDINSNNSVLDKIKAQQICRASNSGTTNPQTKNYSLMQVFVWIFIALVFAVIVYAFTHPGFIKVSPPATGVIHTETFGLGLPGLGSTSVTFGI